MPKSTPSLVKIRLGMGELGQAQAEQSELQNVATIQGSSIDAQIPPT